VRAGGGKRGGGGGDECGPEGASEVSAHALKVVSEVSGDGECGGPEGASEVSAVVVSAGQRGRAR
jgi:hypothetical protein